MYSSQIAAAARVGSFSAGKGIQKATEMYFKH